MKKTMLMMTTLMMCFIFQFCDNNITQTKNEKLTDSVTVDQVINSDSIDKINDSLSYEKFKMNLNSNNDVTCNDVTMKISSISTDNRWTHDCYPDYTIYNDAERGEKFIIVKTTIDAGKNKNPNLPAIYAATLTDKKLNVIGVLQYEYIYWEDYGDYLGNYHTPYAEFEHTQKIKFTCALNVNESLLDVPLLLIVGKKGVFQRMYDNYSTPNLYYESDIKGKLTFKIDDSFFEKYTIIKIFNKDKIK